MTAQLMIREMGSERSFTAGTTQRISAIPAKYIGGAAAPVQEQDCLLVFVQRFSQFCLELAAENGTISGQVVLHPSIVGKF